MFKREAELLEALEKSKRRSRAELIVAQTLSLTRGDRAEAIRLLETVGWRFD